MCTPCPLPHHPLEDVEEEGEDREAADDNDARGEGFRGASLLSVAIPNLAVKYSYTFATRLVLAMDSRYRLRTRRIVCFICDKSSEINFIPPFISLML